MKINYPFNYRGSLVTISLCISSALISACGDKVLKQEKMSETEICARLQNVINDHPNQFRKYKKNITTHKRYNSWSAEKILPSAKECQVWEWSTNLNNYYCEWEAEQGENQAIANFQEASRLVNNCLGARWIEKTNTTRSGGKNTVYSRSNSPTVISIRYFKESRGWFNGWYNTVIIGDKSNLNTPLQ